MLERIPKFMEFYTGVSIEESVGDTGSVDSLWQNVRRKTERQIQLKSKYGGQRDK